jgi:hypothetical protein
MKTRIAAAVLAISAIAWAQAPLAFKFTKGETIKYRSTIHTSRSVSFRGDTNTIEADGSHTITIAVNTVGATGASMTVTYGSAQATAKALALSGEAKAKKSEIEKATAAALKASLSGMKRTQTVTPNGRATYKFSGDGTSFSIEDGAFMMLLLPKSFPKLNETWSANVRLPDPSSTGANKMNYKYLGPISYSGVNALKIGITASDTKSEKNNQATAKMTADAAGYFIFDPASGRLLYGEIKRTVQSTITAKEGTQTSVQKTVQTYTRV